MSVSEPCPPLKCDHGLRRSAIVASLLADVFQGRLRAGQHLVTRELAARFGVSHTPIREALIAMSGIGVIDLQPNRGAIVRRVTPRDVKEICQVRRVLECEAVRRASGRIRSAELETLAAAFRHQMAVSSSQPEARFIEDARALDNQLHDRIAASCGNAFLANELARLKTLFRAFRDVAWAHDRARNDYRRLVEESHEHLAIVEALAASDSRAAARAMSQHIMGGAKYWSRVIRDGAGSSDEGPSDVNRVRQPGEPTR